MNGVHNTILWCRNLSQTVFLSMAFINLLAITPGSPLCGFPVLSYRDLQMAMLTG